MPISADVSRMDRGMITDLAAIHAISIPNAAIPQSLGIIPQHAVPNPVPSNALLVREARKLRQAVDSITAPPEGTTIRHDPARVSETTTETPPAAASISVEAAADPAAAAAGTQAVAAVAAVAVVPAAAAVAAVVPVAADVINQRRSLPDWQLLVA